MNAYSVTQVNRYIRDMFAQDFLLRKLVVRGEISNCKYHDTGHLFFTLKDSESTIACVMFSSKRAGLKFRLENGMQVRALGSIDVYPRDGRYQLYVSAVEADGIGALYERYEALKKKLREEGLFDEAYKRPVPAYIRTLGVVTAPTGAAVRDIIQITRRRNPYVQIILYPAIVQGEAAAPSIVRGLNALADYGVDVIICGRGGGSLEDLWAFNEEIVAQTIFTLEVPVISAVGHETDITIADLVADLRAPTPSAAAELAVFEYDRFAESIRDAADELTRTMLYRTGRVRDRLDIRKRELSLLRPDGRIRDLKMRAASVSERLQAQMRSRLTEALQKKLLYTERLKGLSPYARLKAGYAYVADSDGKRLSSVSQAGAGDSLQIYVRDGRIGVSVTETEKAEATTEADHGDKETG